MRDIPSQEDPAHHIDILNRCIKLAPHLTPEDRYAMPTLWHEDISWQNVLVSEEGPPRILSLIDWQHSRIVPLYLHCHQPHLLDATTDPLPLDEEDQAAHLKDPQLVEQERETLRNIYARAISREALHAVQAFASVLHGKAQESLISNSGKSWKTRKGIFFLRRDLLWILDHWREYKLPDPPPITFTADERKLHKDESRGLENQFQFVVGVLKAVGMTETGEVLTHEYEEKKQSYEEIKKHCIAEAGSPGTIHPDKVWPFRYPDLGF